MSGGPLSLGGLSIERLRTFCRIAEAGSITAAADGDPTKQSQYSRQVKELEWFFGTKLLERAGKTAQLTEAGRRLALITQSYFREIETLHATLSEANLVRIGAGESVLRWLLLPRLGEFEPFARGVRFEFINQRTAQCIEGVKGGRLDMAIVRKDATDASLAALSCGSLNYCLVIPRKLLPGRMAAGLQHLGRVPFAMLSGDGTLTKGVQLVAREIRVLAGSETSMRAELHQ